MTPEQIALALADITGEKDPTLKHLKLASLVSGQVYEPAAECARKLIAVPLAGQVELDWQEARRLAERPEYRILPELEQTVAQVSRELGKRNPYHS